MNHGDTVKTLLGKFSLTISCLFDFIDREEFVTYIAAHNAGALIGIMASINLYV